MSLAAVDSGDTVLVSKGKLDSMGSDSNDGGESFVGDGKIDSVSLVSNDGAVMVSVGMSEADSIGLACTDGVFIDGSIVDSTVLFSNGELDSMGSGPIDNDGVFRGDITVEFEVPVTLPCVNRALLGEGELDSTSLVPVVRGESVFVVKDVLDSMGFISTDLICADVIDFTVLVCNGELDSMGLVSINGGVFVVMSEIDSTDFKEMASVCKYVLVFIGDGVVDFTVHISSDELGSMDSVIIDGGDVFIGNDGVVELTVLATLSCVTRALLGEDEVDLTSLAPVDGGESFFVGKGELSSLELCSTVIDVEVVCNVSTKVIGGFATESDFCSAGFDVEAVSNGLGKLVGGEIIGFVGEGRTQSGNGDNFIEGATDDSVGLVTLANGEIVFDVGGEVNSNVVNN